MIYVTYTRRIQRQNYHFTLFIPQAITPRFVVKEEANGYN